MAEQLYRAVKASNLRATYRAGVHLTATDEQAITLARRNYINSSLGRSLNDAGAFRFFVVARGTSQEAVRAELLGEDAADG